MRTIAVVTGARSDYGIYLPLLRRLTRDEDLTLRLMVTGMHLAPEFGLTVDAIVADGFTVDDRIECLMPSGDAEGTARSIGLGVIGFAEAFGRLRPDLVVVLGDRFEMYAAAVAALPYRIPVAHIHGGELSEGAIDDALRHSMTKLSHLHFVATDDYARRVIQLGEEPWRVQVVGALSLDNLEEIDLLPRPQLEELVGLSAAGRPDPGHDAPGHPGAQGHRRAVAGAARGARRRAGAAGLHGAQRRHGRQADHGGADRLRRHAATTRCSWTTSGRAPTSA